MNDELTYAEVRANLDEECRRIHGFSVDEFERRAHEGTLPFHPANVHIGMILGVQTPCAPTEEPAR